MFSLVPLRAQSLSPACCPCLSLAMLCVSVLPGLWCVPLSESHFFGPLSPTTEPGPRSQRGICAVLSLLLQSRFLDESFASCLEHPGTPQALAPSTPLSPHRSKGLLSTQRDRKRVTSSAAGGVRAQQRTLGVQAAHPPERREGVASAGLLCLCEGLRLFL